MGGNTLRLGTLSQGQVTLLVLVVRVVVVMEVGSKGRGRGCDNWKDILEEPWQELVYPGLGHAPQACWVNFLGMNKELRLLC